MDASVTNGQAVHALASLSPMPKPMLGMGTLSSAHAKIARIKGTFVKLSLRSHLITRGFMPNYTIWTMQGEVGVNVLQENDDDVDMPDVVIHDGDEEPDVNTEPMPTVNNVFRNTLADDTEDNDIISQLLRNVKTGCLSERQLRKLEKMREDGKTPVDGEPYEPPMDHTARR